VSRAAPIKVLTFATLYPNREMPLLGTFVESRLRGLVAGGEVAALVVAPVPWFPWRGRAFGRYGAFARVPAAEERQGITVLHPRYLLIPKIGMTLAPYLMYLSLRACLDRLVRDRFDCDLIDAHYLYPDGVAAILLGRRLGKPVVITAHGTDVNLIPEHAVPRRMIHWAASQAARVIPVADALRQRLLGVGVADAGLTVLPNGVDLRAFAPRDKAAAKDQLGLAGAVVLSIGWLIPRKGHDLVIRAAALLPAVTLLIVGEGPEGPRLRRLVGELAMGDRVRFVGTVPHDRLAPVYAAADVMVLASSREGYPGVVLEALACGTPVVASAVWGTPEILRDPVAGRLVEERSPEAFARAIADLLAAPPAQAAVRAYAERFGWEAINARQLDLFRSILGQRDGRLP
jgi:glycosyltransferase involved in cell wall biosynthesis